MAYKISYKVVSEQGEALKKTAKDMDNYINQLDQITSKLGNDELFQSVREQLKKFRQQLEEERTVLNLAGQVITEVIQSYTGAEKKNVSKVDKAKAHNRDFYKRPVAVASAGGASAGAVAGGGSVNVAAAASSVTNTTVIHNTTNVVSSSPSPSGGATTSVPVTPVASSVGATTGGVGIGEGAAAAAGALGAVAAGAMGAAAAAAAGSAAAKNIKTDSEGATDHYADDDAIDGTYVEV